LVEEPTISPLHIIDLRRELVFRRAPLTHDEGASAHHLRDVPERLSVGVHRDDDRAAGVAVQQNAGRIVASGMHRSAGTPPASTSAYVTASGSLAAK
jgi:hypothetical protein